MWYDQFVGSITKQLDFEFNLMISANKNQLKFQAEWVLILWRPNFRISACRFLYKPPSSV